MTRQPSQIQSALTATPAGLTEKWGGPALIALAFLIMARWSWLTWPDILVDFGRELYIPWQLSTGKHLYTDIAYYSGPLSPYLNAMWFKLFGVGLNTLVWCNLAILAAFVALLYSMVLQISDRLSATVATLAFVLLFAFAQYLRIGNYNYVCPYSHDSVHGIMLSLLALHLAGRFIARRSTPWLVASGLALGLAFLTRAEVFLPGAASATALLAIDGWRRPRDGLKVPSRAAVFVGAAALPFLIAYVLLSSAMPAPIALKGALGTWPATLDGKAAAMHYFKVLLGTADISESLTAIGKWTLLYAAPVFLFLLASRLISKVPSGRDFFNTALFLVTMITLICVWFGNAPVEAFRAMPVVAVVSTISWLIVVIKRPEDPVAPRALAFSLFALAVMGKIILNTHLHHYGFTMTMPVAMIAVISLISWIPRLCERRWHGGAQFKACGLGLIFGFTFIFVRIEGISYASKQPSELMIVRGRDTFKSDMRAVPIQIALTNIDNLVGRNETIVALPEGVMLNYLTRRVNPTPHTNWMPTEFAIFGEENMFRSLRDHPPNWIILVHKDTSEFGVQFFGTDYGRDIMNWVRQNYAEVGTILNRPLVDEHQFGIQFLRKK